MSTAQLTLFEGESFEMNEYERILDINSRMVCGYFVSQADKRLQWEQLQREMAMNPEELHAYLEASEEATKGWD